MTAEEVTEQEFNLLLQQLGQAMSDLSEDLWCAGWLVGAEYSIPALCYEAVKYQASVEWGMGFVSLDRAQQLVQLADKLGCWATLSELPPRELYAPFIPDIGSVDEV